MSPTLVQAFEDPAIETTPLLDGGEAASIGPSSSRWRWVPKITFGVGTSPKTGRIILLCLIPFIQFGPSLNVTTAIDVIRDIVCKLWFQLHDPDNVPMDTKDPRCDAPGVNSWFSSIILIQSVWSAIGSE